MDASRTPDSKTSARALRALRDARPVPYWLDGSEAPAARPALTGTDTCDLAVVGAGFSGLWTALLAKEHDPAGDVVVLEAGTAAGQASGRNGGICMASLTHGFGRGEEPFPRENARLARAGRREPRRDRAHGPRPAHRLRLGVDRRAGDRQLAVAGRRPARDVRAVRTGGDPQQLAGRRGAASGDPLAHVPRRLLASGCGDPRPRAPGVGAGARLRGAGRAHLRGLARDRARARRRRCGAARAVGRRARAARRPRHQRVPAAPPPAARLHVVPVYDYALMTEPLSAEQLDAVGWSRRQALSDAGYMFHYYRLTEDQRILWGGWDAIYHRGRRIRAEYEDRPDLFAKLAGHFFQTFPQLDGLGFTHRWAGVIDTCSRFCQFWGTALDGRVAYVLGYTGAGVAATRFGARVALDLVHGRRTELTEMDFVRRTAAAVPTRAAAVSRDRGDAAVDGTRGAERRPPQSVAAVAGPVRPRVRLLRRAAPRGAGTRRRVSRTARRRQRRRPRCGGRRRLRSSPGTSAPCCGTAS